MDVFVRVQAETTKAKLEVVDATSGEVLADLSNWVSGWSIEQDFNSGRIGMLRVEFPIESAEAETLQIPGRSKP